MKLHPIPLADKGFVSTDPITNPVRWYLEDENGRLLPLAPFNSFEEAEEYILKQQEEETK